MRILTGRSVRYLLAIGAVLILLGVPSAARADLYLPYVYGTGPQAEVSGDLPGNFHFSDAPLTDRDHLFVSAADRYADSGYVPLKCEVGEGISTLWSVRGPQTLSITYQFRFERTGQWVWRTVHKRAVPSTFDGESTVLTRSGVNPLSGRHANNLFWKAKDAQLVLVKCTQDGD